MTFLEKECITVNLMSQLLILNQSQDFLWQTKLNKKKNPTHIQKIPPTKQKKPKNQQIKAHPPPNIIKL